MAVKFVTTRISGGGNVFKCSVIEIRINSDYQTQLNILWG